MQLKSPSKKAKAIRLTLEQKWELAKFCIENKGVVQGEDKEFTIFRVPVNTLAKEFSSEHFKVNYAHVVDCIWFYNKVCVLTNNLAEAPQETVEMDSLKVQIADREQAVKLLEDRVRTLEETNKKLGGVVSSYAERLAQIKRMASV